MSTHLANTRVRIFNDVLDRYTRKVEKYTQKNTMLSAVNAGRNTILEAELHHGRAEMLVMATNWDKLGVEDLLVRVDGTQVHFPKSMFAEDINGYFAHQSGPEYFWLEKMPNGTFVLNDARNLEMALRRVSGMTFYRMMTLTMPAFEEPKRG